MGQHGYTVNPFAASTFITEFGCYSARTTLSRNQHAITKHNEIARDLFCDVVHRVIEAFFTFKMVNGFKEHAYM
jgi:hypothetical protein